MRLKIRCDGESEKFCKIFWEVNKAYIFIVYLFDTTKLYNFLCNFNQT